MAQGSFSQVETLSERARRVHSSSTVIDTHIDTITHLLWRSPEFGRRLPDARVDLPRLREGGVRAAFFAVWVDDIYDEDAALKYVLRGIDAMYRTIDRYPDDLDLALSASDITRIRAADKIAVLLSIEGGRAIADDLGVLRMLHRLGVRSVTLCWGTATGWIDSWAEERHGGLTDFGREVVREMNRIGVIPDISHVSDRAFYDVLETTERPVFASHSSCRALTPAKRNMSDEMIRALAQNGGVININFGSGFVTAEPDQAHTANLDVKADGSYDGWARIGVPSGKTGPPFERLVDHFEHALGLVGSDHVGIGSDFDGVSSVPQGMDDIGRLPALTEALLARGHSDGDVARVLGGSNMRLFREAMG